MSVSEIRFSRSLLGIVATAVATAALLVMLGSAGGSNASAVPVDVFPIPGGRVASPSTQITFRGIPASEIGSIAVTGSATGAHAGQVRADSDGQGGSFVPTLRFKAGERVTVNTGLNVVGGKQGSFSFTVATPAGRIRAAAPRPGPRVNGDVWRFTSRPDLTPAAVRLTKLPSHAEPGGVFVASQAGPLQNGPELLGPYGGLIYFKPVPHKDSATDFRVQAYRGKPVLTWWQGTVSSAGVGVGEDEIYDSAYRPVATIKAGNGLAADLHEFQITPQNTALVTAFSPVRWNASSIKGATKHEIVFDSVVQEIDIPTGLVLYQWDSLDHVALADSHQPPPKDTGHPWDYFHINSIQRQRAGSLIVSSRDTWAVYKISHHTGAVQWTLGGTHSSFKMGPNTTFAFQHDARPRAHNEITIFDDGAGPPAVHKQSRGLRLRLDPVHRTAALVRQYEHRPALLAFYEGNIQDLPDGDDFVGWGQPPYLTEFDSRGREVFDARFVGATNSYRAYRFDWSGRPVTLPAATVRHQRLRTTVYASWNGATAVSSWKVLAGPAINSLKTVVTGGKTAFETTLALGHPYHYVAVQALDRDGHVLGSSKPIKG